MLAMGIWLILDDGSLMELLGNMDQVPGGLAQLAPVSYLLMAIGRALLIMGLLGCRGAVRENRCMAMTFFTLLLIIFVAEIAAAVLTFVFKAEIIQLLKDNAAIIGGVVAWIALIEVINLFPVSRLLTWVVTLSRDPGNTTLEGSSMVGVFPWGGLSEQVVSPGLTCRRLGDGWPLPVIRSPSREHVGPISLDFASPYYRQRPDHHPGVLGERPPLNPPGLMLHRGVVKRGPPEALPGLPVPGTSGPSRGAGWCSAAPPREKESPRGLEARKRQGLQMWQQAVSKEQHSGKVSLALSLKEARQQTCRAIPFPQRVMVEGCEAVTVHNKLCFGQCSSLFVPTGALEEAGGRVRRGAAPAAPPPGPTRRAWC
ncbi:unnamed protein product [Gadus morhua 'NCC']